MSDDPDHAIVQMFEAAVYEAVEAGWDEQRIRDELEAALNSAMDQE